jgi:nucleolar MIF4G domain-containing protein 1
MLHATTLLALTMMHHTPPHVDDDHHPHSVTLVRLLEQDARKKERSSKKARIHKHHSQKLPKNVHTAIDLGEGADAEEDNSTISKQQQQQKEKTPNNVEFASEEGGGTGSSASRMGKAPLDAAATGGKKGKKAKKSGSIKQQVSAEQASGPNARFFEMLQADGLINIEGESDVEAEPVDADEAEMRRLEKLLKMKKGAKLPKEFEEDGLGVFFTDVADEESDQAASEDDDAPQMLSTGTKKKPKKPATAATEAVRFEDSEVDEDEADSEEELADDDSEEDDSDDGYPDDPDDVFANADDGSADDFDVGSDEEECDSEQDEEEVDEDEDEGGSDGDSEEDEYAAEIAAAVAANTKANAKTAAAAAGLRELVFQNSKKFKGVKEGYVYQEGPSGLGYYPDPTAVAEVAAGAGAGGKKDKGKGKAKELKSSKAVRMDEDGQNAQFFEMLREGGLINDEGESRGDGEGALDVGMDDDDAVIERMEKLLKIKKGSKTMPALPKDFEEDGLDMLLGYMDDADEARQKWEATGGELKFGDESDSDEAPEEICTADTRKKAKPAAVRTKAPAPVAVDSEDSEDSEADPDEDEEDTGEEADAGEVEEDSDDADGEKSGEEGEDEEPSEPATYITRAEAFGANKPGGGALTGAPVQKYIPPSQRRAAAAGGTSDPEALRVQRHVKGQMNRLNESNLVVTIQVIEKVFETRSRNEVSTLLSTFILDACMNTTSTLSHLLTVYAASIAVLHHMIGMEVSAHFLQELAENFQEKYNATVAQMDLMGDEGTIDKQCTNIALMLCYLYNFRVVHSTVVFDLFDTLIEKFTPLDVEVLMSCLETSASRLRADDNQAFQKVLETVKTKGYASSDAQSTRMKWMVQTIDELKGNKKFGSDTGATFIRLNKAIKSYVSTTKKVEIKDPLKIPWLDLLEAKTRGRWWLVGSAWAGRDGAGKTAAPKKGEKREAAQMDEASSELLGIAAAQRMNTDVRRQIFCAMMSAEDYLDAFEKLLRLKLKDKQDREVVRVLVDNCLQEKVYNPFYAYLAAKLCAHNHNHKFTFQYALWDRFGLLEEMSVKQVSHLAKLMAHLIVEHSLSLAVLKTVEFNALGPRGVLTFQLFFVNLLTAYREGSTAAAFERLSVHEGQATIKDAMLVFLKHYVRNFKLGIGNGGDEKCTTAEQKLDLLYMRLKLAKKYLTRTSGNKRGSR